MFHICRVNLQVNQLFSSEIEFFQPIKSLLEKLRNGQTCRMEIKKPLTRFDYQRYLESGITYGDYLDNFSKELLEGDQSAFSQYLPVNWQRMTRIERVFTVSAEVKEMVAGLKEPFYWLVISEHWCGDAAQILPVIKAVSDASNEKLRLRIVYRDQNPDLMSAHLTGSSRSIPKLITLDKNFVPIGEWGPRPGEAQKMVLQLKSDPLLAKTYSEKLHKWYAVDKQKSTEEELKKVISRATSWCSDCYVR